MKPYLLSKHEFYKLLKRKFLFYSVFPEYEFTQVVDYIYKIDEEITLANAFPFELALHLQLSPPIYKNR